MPRPTVAEIDLGAIAANLRQIRKIVGCGVKICPSVKADAYGHGAVAVSRALLDAGADMLGVATLEEVSELRQEGIAAPILCLGSLLDDQAGETVDLDATTTVCTASFARSLSVAAGRSGRRAKVHLKVDTGMGRIGLPGQEAVSLAREIASLPHVEIEGIFTHFPSADADDPGMTMNQLSRFLSVCMELEDLGISIPIKHASNSDAILRFPAAHLNMVRPGIILYGLGDPPTDAMFTQAMTLKTQVVFLKKVPAGTAIGYGGTFVTKRQSVIATLPIGYGDGYNRLLSNRGHALVNGKRVPVAGRICMDQTMLDVTDVPDVRTGDEVVLYGRQGGEMISVSEIASCLGTITYEVTCSLGKRVPRVWCSRKV